MRWPSYVRVTSPSALAAALDQAVRLKTFQPLVCRRPCAAVALVTAAFVIPATVATGRGLSLRAGPPRPSSDEPHKLD
jgi:hypothetical protein